MSQHSIRYPVVTSGGKATHVMVPIDAYLAVFEPDKAPEGYTFIPLEVSERILDGMSPLKAWRRHKGLTQEDVAKRMEISRPAYAQMEKSVRPHAATLEKAARAFGVAAAQLADLYDYDTDADDGQDASASE